MLKKIITTVLLMSLCLQIIQTQDFASKQQPNQKIQTNKIALESFFKSDRSDANFEILQKELLDINSKVKKSETFYDGLKCLLDLHKADVALELLKKIITKFTEGLEIQNKDFEFEFDGQKYMLNELKVLINNKEDLENITKQLTELGRSARPDAQVLFLHDLPSLIKQLKNNGLKIEQYWPGIVELGKSAGPSVGPFFDYILAQFIKEKMITDVTSLKKIGEQIIKLGKVNDPTGELSGYVYESTQRLIFGFKDNGLNIKQYWAEIIEIGKSADPNVAELFRYGFPRLIEVFKDNELNIEQYWPEIVEIGKSAGPSVADLFRYGLPTLIVEFKKNGLNIEQYWPEIVEISKSAGPNVTDLFRFDLPRLIKVFKNNKLNIEQYWPEIVEIRKSAGPNVTMLFGYGLPTLIEVFKDNELNIEQYWSEIIEIGKSAGPNIADLFRYGFPTLIEVFKNNGLKIEQYWPEIVEIGKSAGPNVADLFQYGLPILIELKMITDEISLKKFGKQLIDLGKSAGPNVAELFHYGLPILIELKMITDEISLKKFGKQLIDLGKSAGPNVAELFRDSLPRLIKVFKNNGLKIEQYWSGIVEIGKSAGPNVANLFQYYLPTLIEVFKNNKLNIEQYWAGIVELGKSAGPNVTELFRYGLPKLIEIFKNNGLKIEQYWPEIVEIGKLAGPNVGNLFTSIFPNLIEQLRSNNLLNITTVWYEIIELAKANNDNMNDIFKYLLPILIKVNNKEKLINILQQITNFYKSTDSDNYSLLIILFGQQQADAIKAKLNSPTDIEQFKNLLKLFFDGKLEVDSLEEAGLFIANNIKFQKNSDLIFKEKILNLETVEDVAELFPRWAIEIANKATHGGTLEKHLLAVAKAVKTNPAFQNLKTDEDKIVAIISALFHDISKNEIDPSHPFTSAEIIKKVLMQSFITKKISINVFRKIITQITFHHWSEYISKGINIDPAVKENLRNYLHLEGNLNFNEITAVAFRNPKDWEIAKILAKADIETEENMIQYLPDLEKNITTVEIELTKIHNNNIWLPQTSLDLENKIVNLQNTVPYLQNRLSVFIHAMDYNYLSENLQVFQKLGLSTDPFNSLLSTSFWYAGNFNTFGDSKNGLMVGIDDFTQIITALKKDYGTGYKKDFSNLITLLKNDGRGRRSYFSSTIKQLFGITTDQEYETLISILTNYKNLDQIPINLEFKSKNIKSIISEMIIENFLNTSSYAHSDNRNYDRRYNEVVITAPKIIGVFHKGNLLNVPQVLKNFAKSLGVPIYIIPEDINEPADPILNSILNSILKFLDIFFRQQLDKESNKELSQMFSLNEKLVQSA